jgi:fermentation-respiration switch protein FrsA (DUF1100 family)
VPVLVLHPEDDDVIPVKQAHELRSAARENDLVRVWIIAGGGHGAIDVVDRRWFFAVLRGFFERWAGYGRATEVAEGLPREARTDDKLIYSATG